MNDPTPDPVPQPLTDDELRARAYIARHDHPLLSDLLASYDKVRAERDALRSVVREFTDYVDTDTLSMLGAHWTPAQKDVIRSALESATETDD